MEEYKKPSITVDIFIHNEKNEFILIKRKNEPFKNHWALPGGFVDYGESVEDAAIREAKEETSIDVELESLIGVYSKPDRDPRGHTITIAYTAKGDMNKAKADDDACDISIVTPEKLKTINLAFDHEKIIEKALNILNI